MLILRKRQKDDFPNSHYGNGGGDAASPLTKAGLVVGIHIQVFAPFHHALENGHEALQTFLPQTELLKDRRDMAQDLTDKLSADIYGTLREFCENTR